MKWLIRPWIMATASAALVIGAALLILRSPSAQPGPTPSAVASGDHEIVWLSTTTNASAWERFVAAVQRAATRLQDDHPGTQAQIGEAFPKQTTAVPEVSLTLPGGAGRLVFRWYKITTDWKQRDWVEALLKRRPPPLAIIGGNSSDTARELASQLSRQSGDVAEADRPLLLLTTATADRVADPDAPPDAPVKANKMGLTDVYAKRTFRYCFSNKQMAAAVMSFLRTQDDLQPDLASIHMVQWDDDAYSRDLNDGFEEVLRHPRPPGEDVPGCGAASSATQSPPAPPLLLNPARIASSVGSFLTPNRFEAEGVSNIIDDLEKTPAAEPLTPDRRSLDTVLDELAGAHPRPRRPLLVVTGQSAPSRRFLAELARTSPAQARRLVVATGDSLAFNTIYRDRRVAWPIQELPFPLVFFSHYNPIDPDAGFSPESQPPPEAGSESIRSATGTEDVLLNSSIVESLARAFDRDGKPAGDATEVSKRLLEIRHKHGKLGYAPDGTLLFCPNGDRLGGAGETIVCLRPRFDGDRVLPEATIEVWFSRESVKHEPGTPQPPPWTRHGDPLAVSYKPFTVERGSAP
ncbi:MAG TPA: hypothetical protein VMS17_06050 [Gemmataceae bacterium]|nr:hypothetical protein [Gemmataceae bacterium]